MSSANEVRRGNNDIAFGQRWSELRVDIDFEDAPGHRPVNDEGCGQAVTSQPGDERLSFPMPKGRLGFQSAPSQTAPTQPHHLRVRACFVDENQPARMAAHCRQTSAPDIARLSDIKAILFAGQQRFF